MSDVVAVTGSPNTVDLVSVDVLQGHINSPLLGALVYFSPCVDGAGDMRVLGQLVNLETRNRWHEEPALKNTIKTKGRLPHLTGVGDVTSGTVSVLGAYEFREGQAVKTRLTVPPGSGLEVRRVSTGLIEGIMRGDFGWGYLGCFTGSGGVPAPVYVRHFGSFEEGGTGEAYMGGVFGPSGSGKSVLAAELIALWSRSPQMGILIIDPHSEFSSNAFGAGTGFSFDFHEILRAMSGGRFDPSRHLLTLDDLQLEGLPLFVRVLDHLGFFGPRGLGVVSQKKEESLDAVVDLFESQQLRPEEVSWADLDVVRWRVGADEMPAREAVIQKLAGCYSGAAKQAEKRADFAGRWDSNAGFLSWAWETACGMFRAGGGRRSLEGVCEEVLFGGGIYLLNINPETVQIQSPDFRYFMVDNILRRLRRQVYRSYGSRSERMPNCMVVLDEAGRFIPQDPRDNKVIRGLVQQITEGVKEMRKMRCGFMFVTQSVAEINKEIYRNLHYRVYGVGLGIGVDAEHLTNKEGREAFEMYRNLPDPRLSGSFSFMVCGTLLALGSSGKPMFIEGFRSGEEFLARNGAPAGGGTPGGGAGTETDPLAGFEPVLPDGPGSSAEGCPF